MLEGTDYVIRTYSRKNGHGSNFSEKRAKKEQKRAKKGKIFENSRMYEAPRICLGYNDISIK